MEIAGGSLDRICNYDEVMYIEKIFNVKAYLLSNEPMVAVRTNPSNLDSGNIRTTITLYNK